MGASYIFTVYHRNKKIGTCKLVSIGPKTFEFRTFPKSKCDLTEVALSGTVELREGDVVMRHRMSGVRKIGNVPGTNDHPRENVCDGPDCWRGTFDKIEPELPNWPKE